MKIEIANYFSHLNYNLFLCNPLMVEFAFFISYIINIVYCYVQNIYRGILKHSFP